MVCKSLTAALIAEISIRLRNGDFVRHQIEYSQLARLILEEESTLYPELLETATEGNAHAKSTIRH